MQTKESTPEVDKHPKGRRGFNRWAITTFVTVALVSGAVVFYSLFSKRSTIQASKGATSAALLKPKLITALGRLEPRGEVIKLSAPTGFSDGNGGTRVAKLLVKEGDWVKREQVIAILDSHERLQAALKKSQKRVQLAKAKLAQVQAGAKIGNIDAQKARIINLKAELQGQITLQKATIQRLEADFQGEKETQETVLKRLIAQWRNAETECRRYQMLFQAGAITTSERDSKCLASETASKSVNEGKATLQQILDSSRAQIEEAQANLQRTRNTLQAQQEETEATLESIAEIRPTDVMVAQSELEGVSAETEEAQALLNLAYIRTPINGRVLRIHTRPGESVSGDGIVEVGQTDQMYAIAQIYESDIKNLRLGQKAIVTSSAFAGEANGVIDEIGLQIRKKDVLDTDPIAAIDARVVEVKIRLDPNSTRKTANLTNLEVTVQITLKDKTSR
ncbi:MAG: ABC exporter membrane fusion protein [Komarekiella atlantica HA4396-MV6]|jgi:ABC exporter DevB family membrane fusion protein|nr:ABC exporter membrane fusion protein [Komarekiella atlantica HA4396-MV6]